MNGFRFHYTFSSLLLFMFFLIFLPFFFLLFAGSVTIVFSRLGIPPIIAYMLFWFSFIGSAINIPIKKWESEIEEINEINFFGIRYKIPFYGKRETILAINLGGAIIPLMIAVYEFIRLSDNSHLFLKSIFAIIFVAIICKLVAKPVRGLGIAIPAFIPPLAAALVAMSIARENPVVVAYLAGTLGTLIGADLLNLHKIKELAAPMASIGGAGTFDGIFLSGIIAVLLI